jgi:hypothetical protein
LDAELGGVVTPEQEKILIDAGATRVPLKRYCVVCDDDGNAKEDDVFENPSVDVNGDPINPHMWIPPGRVVKIYNEDLREEIVRKIKNEEAPVTVMSAKLK